MNCNSSPSSQASRNRAAAMACPAHQCCTDQRKRRQRRQRLPLGSGAARPMRPMDGALDAALQLPRALRALGAWHEGQGLHGESRRAVETWSQSTHVSSGYSCLFYLELSNLKWSVKPCETYVAHMGSLILRVFPNFARWGHQEHKGMHNQQE